MSRRRLHHITIVAGEQDGHDVGLPEQSGTAPAGLVKVRLIDKSAKTPGLVAVSVSGKRGAYGSAAPR